MFTRRKTARKPMSGDATVLSFTHTKTARTPVSGAATVLSFTRTKTARKPVSGAGQCYSGIHKSEEQSILVSFCKSLELLAEKTIFSRSRAHFPS